MDASVSVNFSQFSGSIIRNTVNKVFAPYEWTWVRVGNFVVKTGFFILTARGAGYSFLPVSKQYAGNDTGLLVMCSGSSFITFTLLDTWAHFKVFDATDASPLSSNPRSSCRFVARKIGSLVFGAGAQFSIGYVAYKVNNNSIQELVLLLLAASSVPAISLLLTMDSFEKQMKANLSTLEKTLFNVRANMCRTLENNSKVLINKPPNERDEFYQLLLKLDTITPREFQLITRQLFKKNDAIADEPSRLYKVGQTLAKGVLGGLGSTIRIGVYTAVAYKAGAEIHLGVGVLAGAVVLSCNAYLNYHGAIQTAKRTYDSVISIFKRQSLNNTLASALHPKLLFCLQIADALMGTFTAATLSEIPRSLFANLKPSDLVKGLSLTTEVMFGIGSFFIFTMAMNSLVETLLTKPYITNEEGKKLIKLCHAYELLSQSISKSLLIETAKLLSILPDDIYQEVTESNRINLDELHRFIKANLSLDLTSSNSEIAVPLLAINNDSKE